MTDPAEQTQAIAAGPVDPSPTLPSPAQAIEPVVLGGRYELTERIASGGMAAVWRAHDDVLARTVAVKLLHDHLAADEDFRERFRREAIAAAKLTHPYVVSLYDTGNDGDRVYLVMEFVDGATLREVMADLGQLEPGQAAAIGEKVARALDYAHERGLVHRDVKPANILLGDDGAVKVADFGIAKADEHGGDLTKTGMVLGTAAYVAPEQITGSTTVDGRADQYALGCMLYEALSGRQPFKGETAVATAAMRLEMDPPPLRAIRPDIPRGLDAIVLQAMARDPADRFPSAGALADAIAVYADADTSATAALPLSTTHRAAVRRGPKTPPAGMPEILPPPPPRGESFVRTEGRWLGLVVILVILAAGLIAALAATGLLDTTALPGVGDDPVEPEVTEAPEPDVEPEPLEIAELVSFDPPDPTTGAGGDGENDEMLPFLLDDDATTTWRTDIYHSAEFGGLKQGVGFTVELDAPAEVTAIDLEIVTPGLNIEVLTADALEAELADWQPAGSARDASSGVIELDAPVTTQRLLVWIAAPLPDADGFKAELAEVRVLGTEETGT